MLKVAQYFAGSHLTTPEHTSNSQWSTWNIEGAQEVPAKMSK